MGLAHLSELFIVHAFHFTLSIFKCSLPVFKIDLLCVNLSLDSLNLLLPCKESVLHPGLVLILEFLNAGPYMVNVSQVLIPLGLGYQYLLTQVYLYVLLILLPLWILILDVEYAQHSIMPS